MGLFTQAVYAKVFSQIFDSSIADDFRLRHFFMDLLVLADPNGVVDMTATAISSRTRIPLKDVIAFLDRLESPDPESRTSDADGRRIERLDDHRTWGWHIINYARFREIASEEQRREKTRIRVAKFKAKRQQNEGGNAVVTHGNAGNAMQRQKQKAEADAKEEAERGFGDSRACFPEIEVPSWKEVQDECQRIGLVEWRARDWFNEMESCGWRDNKNREVVKWRAFLTTVKSWWERDGRPMSPPKGKYGPKPASENPRNFGMPTTGKQAGERAVAELKARGDIK